MLPLQIPLVDNFKDGFKLVQNATNKLKKSPAAFGYFFVMQCLMACPRALSGWLLERYCQSFSIVFSNVPGPKNPYIMDGRKVNSMFFFVP